MLADEGNEVIDAKVCMDRLIESANPFGCDFLATWVWIDYQRVAASDHADCVTSNGGQRMRHWRDSADDSERCVFYYS